MGAFLGTALFVALLGPSACNLISGVDNLAFQKDNCSRTSDCPAPSNECKSVECVDGQCVTTAAIDGFASMQTPGDCKRNVCKAGELLAEISDTDVPTTPTDCDLELCQNGAPSNPPSEAATSCNTSGILGVGLCDGAGQCVQCLETSDCPASGDFCSFLACEADHRCRSHFLDAGTPLPPQPSEAGDCKKRVCDGVGHDLIEPDDTDKPDDHNQCTTDTCSNGSPVFTNIPKDTPCGNNLVCNAFGECTGCLVDADCAPNQECGADNVCKCKQATCASLGATCGFPLDNCGGILDCNNGVKDGAEAGIDCGAEPSCAKCTLGIACKSYLDCQSGFCIDGVCCNEVCDGLCQACTSDRKGYPEDGTCGYVMAGVDVDMECEEQPKASCGLRGTCNGAGSCGKYEDGTECAAAQCDEATSSFTPASICNSGQCNGGKPSTPINCNPYMCVAEGCASLCTHDDDCAQTSYCDNAICKPKKKPGEACNKASACESGPCIDGYCCDTQCGETCKSCNVVGSLGTCRVVPQNVQDVSSCIAPNACDGYGVCKKAAGQGCTQNNECATGNCVDGVCCSTTCGEACRACNVPGNLGTCTVMPTGQPDGDLCKAPSACNAFGVCVKGQASACSIGAECFSGYCFDGVCCNVECKEACKACNVVGSVGACSFVPAGQTDSGTCPAPKSCDGNGVCQ